MQRVPLFVQILALAALYFVTGKFGLGFQAVNGFATLVWLPTGISFAALMLFGKKLWPGILLGAFLTNFATGAAVPVAAGIALGNTLESIVGAFILTRFSQFALTFRHTQSTVVFIALVAVISPLVSATIGVGSLFAGHTITEPEIVATWIPWYVGDAISFLVVAPLLICWYRDHYTDFSTRRFATILAALFLLIIFCLVTFADVLGKQSFIYPYMLFPFFIWVSLAFRQRENTAALFLATFIAVWATAHDLGPYSRIPLGNGLLQLHGFIAVLASTTLIVGAVGAERQLWFTNELAQKEQDFITIATHQLMTPLALIEGNLSLLRQKMYRNKNGQKKIITESIAGTQRITQFIRLLLEASRLEAGVLTIKRERFPLAPLVADIFAQLQAKAKDKKLTLSARCPKNIFVYADRQQTAEIVINLVDNAIKYTDNGSVRIFVQKRANAAEIKIKDTGRGIRKSELNRVFEKFYMSENWIANQQQSHGLGLYISKILVENMGGKISMKSEFKKGSEFIVTLPAA